MVGRDKLTNAVALNSASFNLGRMIGPAVAGGVIALLGSGVGASGWVILLNSATYLAVLVALKQMRSEELHPVPPLPRAKGQLRDGVAYVRSRPDIMLVMAILFVRRDVRLQLPDDHGVDGHRRSTTRAPASTAFSARSSPSVRWPGR